MKIHSNSIIHPDAKIGRDVAIGPFVVIGPDVEIGDGCSILSHAVIEHTTLGRECLVYPQASLGFPPQHLKYNGEKTRLHVGEKCVFREGVTVHRGSPFDHNITQIGNHCYFMALSHIAHDCVVGNNVIIANAAQLAGHVKLGDNCFISGSVAIHQFVRIGTGSLVSGGSMVVLDVAPYCIAQGDRASLKGLNVIGLRRSGLNRNDIKLVKEAYRIMFLSGLRLNDALQQLEGIENNKYVNIFSDFFKEPKRGYTRPSKILSESGVEEELVL